MKLRKFDEIQIDGIHPRNPITDVVIPEYRVIFAVTQDTEGDMLDPALLHPRHPAGDAPIAMTRIVRLNGRKLDSRSA